MKLKFVIFQKYATSERSYVEKHELIPIQSKIDFLEKLVCAKLGKMNLEEKTESSDTSLISVNEVLNTLIL